jgi:hypothetical protein
MEEGFKMRLKYTLTIIFVICLANCLICNIYASVSPTTSKNSPNRQASTRIIDEEHRSIDELNEQIALLQAKNRLLEEKNRNLINNLYRALSFAPMFIIAVLGLIIYLTHRRYEKDKFLLMCIIKSEIAKAKAGLEEQYSGFGKKPTGKLPEKTDSLEQSFRSIAESITTEALKPIDERTKSLMGNRLVLQMEISALQAEQQTDKGQLNNALRCWLDVAQKALAIDWKWRVAYALDKIKYLLENGAKITLQSSKAEMTAFLQSLPPQFEPLVKAIQSKI